MVITDLALPDDDDGDDEHRVRFGLVPKVPESFLSGMTEVLNPFANVAVPDLMGPNLAEALLPLTSMVSDMFADAVPESFLSDMTEVLAGLELPADFAFDFIRKDPNLADSPNQLDASLALLDPLRIVVGLVVIAFALAAYLARRQIAAGAEVVAPDEVAANATFVMATYHELVGESWVAANADKVLWMWLGYVVPLSLARARARRLESADDR